MHSRNSISYTGHNARTSVGVGFVKPDDDPMNVYDVYNINK